MLVENKQIKFYLINLSLEIIRFRERIWICLFIWDICKSFCVCWRQWYLLKCNCKFNEFWWFFNESSVEFFEKEKTRAQIPRVQSWTEKKCLQIELKQIYNIYETQNRVKSSRSRSWSKWQPSRIADRRRIIRRRRHRKRGINI